MNKMSKMYKMSKITNKDLKFSVKVSFVEVYNEEIKDLFSLKGTQETLNIREEKNTIRVMNLSEIEVKISITTIQLLEQGFKGRIVGGTAMDNQSSRSHAIFTITLEQANCSSQSGRNSDNGCLIKSKFY
ncbi:chromosome-associated kinesin KIF4B [Brachionus plicatilis]|uniref:Chromosome-associated kinesin KIF4B n=1 Tax=Brachionus plicatilis TaxID=10195 RepID=A0A3M7QTB8_BRAPC|nr:chromosome-associated kinesin KIF4B [Brachionus plicatilis]